MRLLAIGYALPDAEIDNYSVFSAPSYSDYDALFIDPASITHAVQQLISGATEFTAFDDRPVLNAPSSASAVSGADQIRRRADETRRLLESGGTVVVMARPNAVQPGLLGFEGCDRYSWLPAPGGLSWGLPFIRPAEGRTVRVTAVDHPAASLLRNFRAEVASRASFDDHQPELRREARFLAVGGSGVPIAAEFQILGGRVVFVPAFQDAVGHNRPDLARAIVELCARLDAHGTAVEPPYWSQTVPVPGLEEVEAEVAEADTAASQANSHAAAVRERHDALARHRRLLYEDGTVFAGTVADSLRLLGFAVEGGAGEPVTATSEAATAFVEVESSRGQILEWPYVRLQRRLEEHLLKQSEQLKGIVVVNAYRDLALDQRSEPFTEALRVACENYRYTLITAETLFDLVKRVLGGADQSVLLAVRRRLMTGAGFLTLDQVLTEQPPAEKSETIF
ncbi:MAG: hypothetical protein ABI782_11605 [Anaerolineaceae bacterium]